MVCRFVGGPLDGSTKLLPNSWLSFNVPAVVNNVVPTKHLYTRDDEEPDIFDYEGLE